MSTESQHANMYKIFLNQSFIKPPENYHEAALQNWLHIILGCGIILIAWVTIVFGIKEWEFLGRGTPLVVSVLMGVSCGTAICLYLAIIWRPKINSPKFVESPQEISNIAKEEIKSL